MNITDILVGMSIVLLNWKVRRYPGILMILWSLGAWIVLLSLIPHFPLRHYAGYAGFLAISALAFLVYAALGVRSRQRIPRLPHKHRPAKAS